MGLKHLRLKFFQSKIFFELKFFQTKIIVPKLYLKLEFDTEDQVLFPLEIAEIWPKRQFLPSSKVKEMGFDWGVYYLAYAFNS